MNVLPQKRIPLTFVMVMAIGLALVLIPTKGALAQTTTAEPSPPTEFSAEHARPEIVYLQWTLPNDHDSLSDEFQLQYRERTTPRPAWQEGAFVQLRRLSATDRWIVRATGFESGAEYEARLRTVSPPAPPQTATLYSDWTATVEFETPQTEPTWLPENSKPNIEEAVHTAQGEMTLHWTLTGITPEELDDHAIYVRQTVVNGSPRLVWYPKGTLTNHGENGTKGTVAVRHLKEGEPHYFSLKIRNYGYGRDHYLESGWARTKTHNVPEGPPSAEVEPTPEPTPEAISVPAKPARLKATPIKRGVILGWSEANDETITGYQFRVKAEKESAWRAWRNMKGSHEGTRAHALRGLTPELAYIFQVRARNAKGPGAPATATQTTGGDVPQAPPPGIGLEQPLKPVNLSATGHDRTVILLWTKPADPENITSYQFRLQADGETGWRPWRTFRKDLDQAVLRHDLVGITNGKSYNIQIRAINPNHKGPAAETSATPVGK